MPQSSVPAAPTPRDLKARLILAWLVTLTVLPYCWARTLVFGMMDPRGPGLLFPGLALAGIVAVVVLTGRLAGWFTPRRFWLVFGVGVLAAWLAEYSLLVGVYTGSLMPKEIVFALLVPATLWVPWAAWLSVAPFGWATRLAVLVVLLAAVAPFALLLRVEGLTGEGAVNFAWRTTALKDAELDAALRKDVPSASVIELHPGPHDYPQYLGPNRLGILPHAKLARDWSATPPKQQWRRQVGAGWSGFAVVGDHVFTQEQRGKNECVVCYRLADGALAWIHEDEERFDSSMGGPGPRATPTVLDGRVYSVGARGRLNCLDAATGKVVWSVNILEEQQAENLVHGVCASPLVVGELVIVCPTGQGGPSLVAYQCGTGQRAWQAGTDRASYGSPLLAELQGQQQVLIYQGAGIAAHDPANGKLLWRFEWTNLENVNCSQPVPNADKPGRVFVATGYGKGCVLVAVDRSSDGSWTATSVWDNRNLKTKFTSPVVRDGYAYGLDDGILACVRLADGKRQWKGGRYQHGQVLLAGDLLLVQAEEGYVALVETTPDAFRELGRIAALEGKTWNNPALSGKYLLVRNDHEAACYELPLRAE